MNSILRLPLLVRLFFSVFFGLGSGLNLHAQSLAPPPPTFISDSLQSIWQEEISGFNAEGGIIGIYLPGQWYWAGATGNALVNPVETADTARHFRVGSLAKSMVSASLLRLQENLVLTLEDTITDWLDPAISALIPNAGAISIRQVLNHTSGIGNYTSDPGFISTLATNGIGHVFTPADLIGFGVAQGALFPPGTAWGYSNTNYVVAALVIEGATGIAYETYITNNFLVPLGLFDSYFPTTDTLPGTFMGSFFDINNVPPKEDFSYVSPTGAYGAGALVSKVPDMIRWGIALSSGQVLNVTSMNELATYLPSTWPNIEYGLGIGRYDNGTYNAVGHTGAVFNSSNIQRVNDGEYYMVYNVTDQEFPHYPFMDRIYAYLNPYIQACATFLPGNITGSPLRGLNVGETLSLQGPVVAGASYEWYRNGVLIPNTNASAYTANFPGSYTVRIISAQGCISTSDPVVLQDCSPYQVPINNLGPVGTYCSGTAVLLTAGTATDTVDWFNPGGLILQDSNSYGFTATANTQIFTVSTNAIGCVSRDSLDVVVQNPPIADLGADQSLCVNSQVNLTAGVQGDAVDWFNITTGTLIANTNTYSFPLTASQQIRVSVSNVCGQAVDTLQINMITNPSADLGPDRSFCTSTPVSLTTGLPTDVVDWYDFSGNLLLSNSQTYSFTLNLSTSIIAQVNNACGQARDTVSLLISSTPTVDLGPDLQLCTGSQLNLSAGTSLDTTNWFDIAGNLVLANSQTYSFTANANQTLVAEVRSSCGQGRDTIALNVSNAPVADLGPDLQICTGSTVTLNAGTAQDQVNWLDFSGNILLANSQTYTPTLNASQTLIVEVSNSCGQERDTLSLVYAPAPSADLGPDVQLCLGNPLNLSAGTNLDTTNWFDMLGNLVLANSQNYTLAINTTQTLIAEVRNVCGQDRDTITVNVFNVPVADLGPDQQVCPGSQLSLTAGTVQDQVNWYDFSGNLLLGNSQNYSLTVNTSQTLITEVSNICGIDRDTLSLVLGLAPNADLGADRSLCAGEVVNLSTGTNTDTTDWYDLAGTLLLANSQNYNLTVNTSQTLISEVRNACGLDRDTLVLSVIGAPQVDLGSNLSVCLGSTLSLSAGMGSDSVNWYAANGNLALANSQSYSLIVNSSLEIITEVFNQCESTRDTLAIATVMNPIADLGADVSNCSGFQIDLNQGTADDTVNWYNQNGGLLLANSGSYSFTLQNTGYIVSEVINVCGAARDTLNFTVFPDPIADLGPDISDCQNSMQTFELGQPGDSVNWYNMMGDLVLANNRTLVFMLSNSGGLIGEVINECSIARDTVFLQATNTPTVDLGPDTTSCPGTTFSFSVGTSGDLVNWFDGNGTLLAADTLDYSFVLTNNVLLIVERITSCGNARDSVLIETNPTAQIDLGPDLRICDGQRVNLNAGNIPSAVDWFDAAGSLIASDTNQISVQVVGVDQQIVAAIQSSCGDDRDTINVISVPLPIVDLGPDTTILSGQRLTLSAGQVGDIVNWYNGNGDLLLGNNTSFFINPQAPITIIAEVISPDICVGRDTINVDISAASVPKPIDIGLEVFPNPAKELLFLNWEVMDFLSWEWEIASMNGQVLRSSQSDKAKVSLDVSDLPEGVYLLRIQKEDQHAMQLIQVIH